MDDAAHKPDLLLTIVSHVFSLTVAGAALGAAFWVVSTKQLFTIDGLGLVLITGAIATFFVANSAWAVYQGEVQALFAVSKNSSGSDTGDAEKPKP